MGTVVYFSYSFIYFRQLWSIDIHITHTYTEKRTDTDRQRERDKTHSQNTPYNVIITH